MRNLFSSKYMYLTAAMLTGAAMFTSCSNEDDMGNVNPTYDGESVKTQFAINIPAAKKADTKMAGDIVQKDGNFRGMKDIKLIPFATKPTAGTETNLGQVISLGDFTTLIPNSNAQVYNDVTIPVGTGAVLLYGQANTTTTDNFANGAVTPLTDYSTLSNIKFTPVNITANTTDAKATALANWMTNVANATDWNNATINALIDLRTEYLKATAGSSNSVLRLMQYLYDAVINISGTADDDIAAAIITAITTQPGVTETSGTLSYDGTTLAGYPENINLPDGAAKVEWNTNKFEVIETEGNTGLNTASFDSYIYPAPLCYYVNSTVKTADTEVNLKEEVAWGTILGNLTGTSVTATTRSIAINDVINYGVGRLDVRVICKEQRIPDNKDDGHNSSVVDVPTDGFTITGVLIGGQGEVAWNYEPTSVGKKTIYDKTMPANMAAKYATDFAGATTNYTLAFETVANTNVNVAIEFVNNSTRDFYGKDGEVIPVNGKFYLIGALTAKQATETGSKVFKQDYNTTAQFSISSLKDAYHTLPDLRTPELQLGMSVNLDWTAGHVFDVTIN